jgi:hypothetical protein
MSGRAGTTAYKAFALPPAISSPWWHTPTPRFPNRASTGHSTTRHSLTIQHGTNSSMARPHRYVPLHLPLAASPCAFPRCWEAANPADVHKGLAGPAITATGAEADFGITAIFAAPGEGYFNCIPEGPDTTGICNNGVGQYHCDKWTACCEGDYTNPRIFCDAVTPGACYDPTDLQLLCCTQGQAYCGEDGCVAEDDANCGPYCEEVGRSLRSPLYFCSWPLSRLTVPAVLSYRVHMPVVRRLRHLPFELRVRSQYPQRGCMLTR